VRTEPELASDSLKEAIFKVARVELDDGAKMACIGHEAW
jgi:hypothetical protein